MDNFSAIRPSGMWVRGYRSLYGPRHWSVALTPQVYLIGSTDFSGEGSSRFGTGAPCDIQVVKFIVGWFGYQVTFGCRWRI